MKKTIVVIMSVLFPILVSGQAQINTKKIKLGDFTQKVTKVVLSGNDFFDSALQDEITIRWRISPYEFCTLEEFNSMKGNDEYYFLICTTGQFRKDSEPTLQFLTLVKGGDGADKGIDGMLEVVSLPIASARYPSGREIIFLPSFIDIIQNYTLDSMERDINAYGGLGNYSFNLLKSEGFNIVFSDDDINENVSEAEMDMFFGDNMRVTDEDEADALMTDNAENTLVSYIVAPTDAEPGSYCYKMLIDAQSHRLYYYKKHKVTRNTGTGFLKDDLRRIWATRKR